MREYFKSITEVCPFSLQYFDSGRIPILEYSETLVRELYDELDKYPAILFKVHTSICRHTLESTAHELADEYPDAEWFWSHPAEGGHSSPVPVVIMQNKLHLTNARKTFKLIRNGSKMVKQRKSNQSCQKED